jgi:predicted RNA-binding Zn-ribbon protein involved in translation (DUF1610 family)
VGSNNGTGEPSTFRCAKCRRENPMVKWQLTSATVATRGSYLWRYLNGKASGYADAVTLTGRRKKHSTCGIRHGMISREYRCSDCGHVGWSRHIGLEALPDAGPKARTRRRGGSE